MLLDRASTLWEGLHPNFQELINAIFWDGSRFERFCRGPSSIRGHHQGVGENLCHAVEVAETMLGLLSRFPVWAFKCDILSHAGKTQSWNCACLGVKNIGKPCALIAHARFDEGGQGLRRW